jgi:hypothetical protein
MTLMPIPDTDLLKHALIGLEHRKEEINQAIARLRSVLDGAGPAHTMPAPAPKRRTMTAAGRRRLALSMKRRWAKAKKAGRKRLG